MYRIGSGLRKRRKSPACAFSRGFRGRFLGRIAEGHEHAPRAIGAGLLQFPERPPERLGAEIFNPIRALQPVKECRDVDESRPGVHEVKVEQMPSIHVRQNTSARATAHGKYFLQPGTCISNLGIRVMTASPASVTPMYAPSA